MTDRARATSLLLASALLIASAGVHALMGWRDLRTDLAALHVNPRLAGVLGAGWQFGSVSLLAFGLIALTAGSARWRGDPVASVTLWVPAAALAGFGTGALLLVGYEPFYFGYILLGILLALGAKSPAAARSR